MPPSPEQENGTLQFPKAKQLSDLNTEIAKINSRRDSGELSLEKNVEAVRKDLLLAEQQSGGGGNGKLDVPGKERKVSRFRISVVREPDDAKLAVPDKHESAQEAIVETPSGSREEPTPGEVKPEVRAAINDTYEILENIIIKSYPVQGNSKTDKDLL